MGFQLDELSLAYALHIQSKKRCSNGIEITSARFGRTGLSGRRPSRRSSTIRFPSMNRALRGELRFVYYGETSAGRLLAVIVTDRRDTLRVVTAYPLDAGQKRDYLRKRVQGE